MTDPDAADIDQAIARTCAGDLDAYRIVVERLSPWLLLWIGSRCPSDVDPEEVLHETFLAAYPLLGRYAPGTSARAWFSAIAGNRLLTFARRSRRHRNRHRELIETVIAPGVGTEPSEQDAELHLEALRTCLDQLGNPARELLDQRYREDLPLEALAKRLGRSSGAVAKSLCLLRARLHDCIRSRLRST